MTEVLTSEEKVRKAFPNAILVEVQLARPYYGVWQTEGHHRANSPALGDGHSAALAWANAAGHELVIAAQELPLGLLPAGEYDAVFASMDAPQAGKGPTWFNRLRFEVEHEGEKRVVMYFLPGYPETLTMLYELSEHLIGRHYKVRIKHTSANGRTYADPRILPPLSGTVVNTSV